MGGGRLRNAARMIVREVLPTPGVKRPGSAQTANIPQPQQTAQVPRVLASAAPLITGLVDSSSIYFLPYRYYISSEVEVFQERGSWEEKRRYAEFLRVMKTKMQADYSLAEAEIVCCIFNFDMRLMFYEKAIQELRERRVALRLTADRAEYLWNLYCKRLESAKLKFSQRNTAVPPADFSASALWFATFSKSALDGFFAGEAEHAGSIYFDGGRIRLMHRGGPEIDRQNMVRILRTDLGNPEPGRRILTKQDGPGELSRLVAAARRQYPGEEALYEYDGIRTHTSRGYPKKIVLNNSEIVQLYYVVYRLDEVRIDGNFRKDMIAQTGNKLLIQFLRSNARLRRELGYEGLI